MARRMEAAYGQLVSFDDEILVRVSTEREPAELWLRQVELDGAATPGDYAKLADVPANQSGAEFSVPTPSPGSYTQVRLFGAHSGTPSGDGLLVDELVVPRLDRDGRRTFLSDCTEGWPQVAVSTGGTWVRGLVGSGAIRTLGQVFLGREAPVWHQGETFPRFPDDAFLFAGTSGHPDMAHDVLVVDQRSDGWPTGPGLAHSAPVWFVVLAWDSAGLWDVTWSSRATLPVHVGPVLAPPEQLRTLDRQVGFHVTALVCVDDSDDWSTGEAVFALALRPSDGGPDQTATVDWPDMDTGATLPVDVAFGVRGAAAEAAALAVAALEDDSDSPFGDDPDGAVTDPFRLGYPRGPVAESYVREATLVAGPGGDGFRFQVHCTATVSYV